MKQHRVGGQPLRRKSPARLRGILRTTRERAEDYRSATGGSSTSSENVAPLYVLYVRWNGRYEIISVEDHLEDATSLSAEVIHSIISRTDEKVMQANDSIFLQKITPDGISREDDVLKINPTYYTRQQDGYTRISSNDQAPVYFSLRSDGLISSIHYDMNKVTGPLPLRVLPRNADEWKYCDMFSKSLEKYDSWNETSDWTRPIVEQYLETLPVQRFRRNDLRDDLVRLYNLLHPTGDTKR
jgi:hypothetical protein